MRNGRRVGRSLDATSPEEWFTRVHRGCPVSSRWNVAAHSRRAPRPAFSQPSTAYRHSEGVLHLGPVAAVIVVRDGEGRALRIAGSMAGHHGAQRSRGAAAARGCSSTLSPRCRTAVYARTCSAVAVARAKRNKDHMFERALPRLRPFQSRQRFARPHAGDSLLTSWHGRLNGLRAYRATSSRGFGGRRVRR